MCGVAAKADSQHHRSTVCVRPSPRSRQRHSHSMLKPLKIPAKVPEEPETKSAPVSSRQLAFSTPSSQVPVLVCRPEVARPAEHDTDTDTEVSTFDDSDASGVVGPASSCRLTDFSNYLGISIVDVDEDDGASMTVVDSDAYGTATSVNDVYGWEAEIDRQMKCGTNPHQLCGCRHLEYRGADSYKRGFLQRVFHAGSTIAATRRASTGI